MSCISLRRPVDGAIDDHPAIARQHDLHPPRRSRMEAHRRRVRLLARCCLDHHRHEPASSGTNRPAPAARSGSRNSVSIRRRPQVMRPGPARDLPSSARGGARAVGSQGASAGTSPPTVSAPLTMRGTDPFVHRRRSPWPRPQDFRQSPSAVGAPPIGTHLCGMATPWNGLRRHDHRNSSSRSMLVLIE